MSPRARIIALGALAGTLVLALGGFLVARSARSVRRAARLAQIDADLEAGRLVEVAEGIRECQRWGEADDELRAIAVRFEARLRATVALLADVLDLVVLEDDPFAAIDARIDAEPPGTREAPIVVAVLELARVTVAGERRFVPDEAARLSALWPRLFGISSRLMPQVGRGGGGFGVGTMGEKPMRTSGIDFRISPHVLEKVLEARETVAATRANIAYLLAQCDEIEREERWGDLGDLRDQREALDEGWARMAAAADYDRLCAREKQLTEAGQAVSRELIRWARNILTWTRRNRLEKALAETASMPTGPAWTIMREFVKALADDDPEAARACIGRIVRHSVRIEVRSKEWVPPTSLIDLLRDRRRWVAVGVVEPMAKAVELVERR